MSRGDFSGSNTSRVASKPASEYRIAALLSRIFCFSAIMVKATSKLRSAQKNLLPSPYPLVETDALLHASTHMCHKSALNANCTSNYAFLLVSTLSMLYAMSVSTRLVTACTGTTK